MNLNGVIEDLIWDQPHVHPSPNQSSLTYDKERMKLRHFKHSSQKIYCDLNRICEIEDSCTEWYEP